MFDEVNNDVRAAPEENKIGLGKIREWFQDAVDKSRNWRKEAKEDYRFVSGKQWKNADKEQLEKFGRPAITINKIKPLMNGVYPNNGSILITNTFILKKMWSSPLRSRMLQITFLPRRPSSPCRVPGLPHRPIRTGLCAVRIPVRTVISTPVLRLCPLQP